MCQNGCALLISDSAAVQNIMVFCTGQSSALFIHMEIMEFGVLESWSFQGMKNSASLNRVKFTNKIHHYLGIKENRKARGAKNISAYKCISNTLSKKKMYNGFTEKISIEGHIS